MIKSVRAYRDTLNEIEEGYIENDLSGKITWANKAMLKILGYPSDEYFGKNFRKFVDKEIADKIYSSYNQVYTTGIPIQGLIIGFERKDGTPRFIESSISLVKDSKGRLIGFRGVHRDITDRRNNEQKLAEHEALLGAIFQTVEDSIITVDTKITVTEVNNAAENLCGLTAKNTFGKPLSDCLSQCNRLCQEVLNETLREKKSIKDFQIDCRRKNLPNRTMMLRSFPLIYKDGRFSGAMLVIRDLTRVSDLEIELRERYKFQNIFSKSRKMQDIYTLVQNLADVETTVLITGETGTGKDLVARALHNSGRRAFKPLVIVNCSALSENLLESELFGHVKGAFTGALADKEGRFKAAHGGTIVLDEVGDIAPRIQLKLLRVLQEKEFERVGESKPTKVDVRIIGCTNQDLRQKIRNGEFRADFYYRLNVVEINLPALRERPEDIPILVENFIKVFKQKFGKKIDGMSNNVLALFKKYHWPGNVRELENSVEHAFVLCRGRTITPEDLPSELREDITIRLSAVGKQSPKVPQDIVVALNKTGWNIAKASRLLGITRPTLYRKVQEHGLKAPTDVNR
jgi:two-component system, NtrC family, response regulator HydG